MKQYTDITILLDRSGSMENIKNDMEGALKEFVTEHQKTPSTRMTLIRFDGQNSHDVVFEDLPVKDVKTINIEPRGWTPLIDAFVTAIDCTGSRLARMKEADRPDQVLFVVITDGEENASKRYKRHDVYNRVSHQTHAYKWQFVYLGANQDAIKEARSYGISPAQALDWATTTKGIQGATRGLISTTSTYVANLNRNDASSLTFTDEDRKSAKQ